MTTVVCVLKSGGDYTPEYVYRLRDGVMRNSPDSTQFVCYSDMELDCERVELKHNWPGWWSKIEAFQRLGPVLYFDLDTVIVANIKPLLDHAKRTTLTLLSDFYRPHLGQSGVMAWSGDVQWIYKAFKERASAYMSSYNSSGKWGDGAFIYDLCPQAERWQKALPGLVSSRKVAATRSASEAVVCFHGRPRPADVGWVV